jgi:uncharacterized membrane protein
MTSLDHGKVDRAPVGGSVTPGADAVQAHGIQQRVAHLRAFTRLACAVAVSVATMLLLPRGVKLEMRMVASWDAFAVVALALTWVTILTVQPAQIRALATREDPSRLLALVLVVLGAGASLLAVLVLLQESMTMRGGDRTGAIILALSAVAFAWTLIHTVFTLRYAHLYYDAPAGSTPLEFPGLDTSPDYLDFAYFAFIVGMTAQTADVNIRNRRIRRTALLHGVVAFAFNTAVVALSIGVLSTLL